MQITSRSVSHPLDSGGGGNGDVVPGGSYGAPASHTGVCLQSQ